MIRRYIVVLILVLLSPFLLGSNALAIDYSQEEIVFAQLLNEYRISNGLSALQVSDVLSESGDRHNSDMAKYDFFGHHSISSDWFAIGASPITRMAHSGYPTNVYWGENIAAGFVSAESVFLAWKESPSHNQNLLSPNFNVLGVSLSEYPGSEWLWYWTTDFGSYVDQTAHDVTSPTTTTTTIPPTTTTSTTEPTTTTTLPVVSDNKYFRDIGPTFYAFEEIQYCFEKGYFDGYGDNTFRPYTNILEGHIHNILNDGIRKDYYKIASRRYVSDIFDAPLFGREDNTLNLYGSITRAQVAILLYSRDNGTREPEVDDSLIGYWNKYEEEVAYIHKYASGAKLTCTVEELVYYYNYYARLFGLRADFALAQAIKETGHFEYGGLVEWTDNNFCGLGGGPSETVASFFSAKEGVIAHLAHLACYAYPSDLDLSYCSIRYDPKHTHLIYNMLNPLGGQTKWIQLNGVWAVPGTSYAQDIARIASRF